MPASSAALPRPALLDGLFDYAGLFPPAALALDDAAAQYTAHRAQPEAWMLGRFVVPLASAPDLALRLPGGVDAELSVLGTGGDTAEAFLDAFDADLRALGALHRRYGRVRARAYEVRLPSELLRASLPHAVGFLGALGARQAAAPEAPQLFLEVPVNSRAAALLRVLRGTGHGVKFRTGGLAAEAFPSPADLAEALDAAARFRVPFKCTAGLHHPVRMHRPEVEARMHGFLNVFGGAVLRHAGAVKDAGALRGVLEDEDAAAWGWTDDGGLRYRDLRVPAGAVRVARAFATGLGSCSFDEPVDDLRALGLL